jgi:hypothetical protein
MFLKIDDAVRVIRDVYPEVVVPSWALIQKGRNTFHFYVDATNMEACQTFARYVNTETDDALCMKDENDEWVPKVQFARTGAWNTLRARAGSAMQVDNDMKEMYIVVGLEGRHTIDDVQHILRAVEPDNNIPDVEVSAPRGTHLHQSVFRLNGGGGAICLAVPNGTRQTAKSFGGLIDVCRTFVAQNICFCCTSRGQGHK